LTHLAYVLEFELIRQTTYYDSSTFGVRKNRGNTVSSSPSPQYVRARHA